MPNRVIMVPGTCSYRILVLTLLFVWLHFGAVAQHRMISGTVKSDQDEALPSASVLLIDENSVILKYAITNQAGHFKLPISSSLEPSKVWLEVSFLGFKKQRKSLDDTIATYHFILTPDPKALSEVIVRNRPIIERMGDTLRYEVMSFARPEDRSIGDVLRRMPGIDIAADGTIYHNGKKIENLYIHGDDLMDGKYGLATKAITKEMIASIDVIQNFQPIKVLKGKVFSDKTAINLILKDENSLKLSVKSMLGAGLPGQYDASVTPILLNKKVKSINTVGGNNSGVDYRDDFKQLGSSSLLSNLNRTMKDFSLSQGTAGPPDLPLSYYYFNNSRIINLNSLYNLKQGLQLKVNIQSFSDRNQMLYDSRVESYLENDTIVYREQQTVNVRPSILATSFNLMANREHYFLSINLRGNLKKNTDNSLMRFNENSFEQSFKRNLSDIANELSWIPALGGKGAGEIRWLISYTGDKQVLSIEDGYYAEIVNHTGYFDRVVQRLRVPTLFSNAYSSYKIPGETISQEYKVGYIQENQQLNSRLNFVEGQWSIPYAEDSGNDLNWNRRNVYFSSEYQLNHKKIRAIAQLPVALQNIAYFQERYDLNSNKKHFLFNPLAQVRYDLGNEQSLAAKYKFSNAFGDLTNVYRGAILRNYRLLEANDADLQQKYIHSASLNYDFQRSISMLFINIGLTHDKTIANTILSTDFSNNIQNTVVLPFKNDQTNTILNWGISKYLFGVGSTVSLKSRLARSQFSQVINSELIPFKSESFSYSATLSKKFFNRVTLTYQPNCQWYFSRVDHKTSWDNTVAYKAFRIDQNLVWGLNAAKSLDFELKANHSFTTQTNSQRIQYLFGDARLRHSNKKSRMDLGLELTNVFNVKNYMLYSIYTNQLGVNQYQLRGRMATVRLEHYF